MKLFKNIIKNFGILIGLLIVLALINRRYLGGFAKLEVKEQNVSGYMIAYKNFVGEYAKVGPTMTQVYEILSGAGVTSMTGVGIYYDDPAVVSGAELRSDIGAVIDAQDVKKLVQNKDIKIVKIAGGNKIVIEFPLKSNFSSMIGPMRVYPAMTKYMLEKGYTSKTPMIELYDVAAKKIYYIADSK